MHIQRVLRLTAAGLVLMSAGGAAAIAADAAFQPQLTAPASPVLTAPPAQTATTVYYQQTQHVVQQVAPPKLPPNDIKNVQPTSAGSVSADGMTNAKQFFRNADKDHDGLVSFSEFYAQSGTGYGPGDIRLSKKFAVLDSNQDKTLSRDEIMQNYGKPYDAQPQSLRWTPNGTDRD